MGQEGSKEKESSKSREEHKGGEQAKKLRENERTKKDWEAPRQKRPQRLIKEFKAGNQPKPTKEPQNKHSPVKMSHEPKYRSNAKVENPETKETKGQLFKQKVSDSPYELPQRKTLPLVETHSEIKVDLSKCMFFTQGHNNIYTHDVMQLYLCDGNTTKWSSLQEQYILDTKVNVLATLKISSEQINILSQLGTFVLCQNKWGYLLQLSSLDKVYQGQLSILLKRCLCITFFQTILRKYAFYVLQDRKHINIRDIKSTENDIRLTKEELEHCEILLQHQRQEVGWMLNLQRYPYTQVQNGKVIPLFDSGYYFKQTDSPITLYKASQIKQKQTIRIGGSILASDIGTGKTASMLFLILISKLTSKKQLPTLAITPDSILYQWVDQINKFTPSLKYCVIDQNHGHFNPQVISNFDVVLVSRAAYTKTPLLDKQPWKRLVVDEFHQIIKDVQKGNKRYLFQNVKCQMIWGVTGTPHNVDYLSNISIVGQMLRFDKWLFQQINTTLFRRCFIETCIRKNCNVFNLPNVKKEIDYSQMRAVDSVIYKAKAQFAISQEQARNICFNILPSFQLHEHSNSLQKGVSILQNRLQSQIAILKTQLQRQAAVPARKGIQQKISRLQSQNSFYRQVIHTLMNPQFQCAICLQIRPTDHLVLTECFHYTCNQCYALLFKLTDVGSCPMCKAIIQKGNCIINPDMQGKKNKIQVLIEAFYQIPEGQKLIIFTQFHNLVERISTEFDKLKIQYMELKGVPSEINYRLNVFRNNPHMRILLLSIEQAASGINLTQANHVFFAHPILGNDYTHLIRTYHQCIGRVHRLGQNRPVQAKLFVSKNTLQDSYKKYFMS